jgi:hypothetical protein
MQYYSYDPNGDFEFHETEEAAKAAFDRALRYAEDELADGSTDDNISDISWGVVRQQLRFEDRDPTDEEKEIMPEVGYIREISVEDLPNASVMARPDGGPNQ